MLQSLWRLGFATATVWAKADALMRASGLTRREVFHALRELASLGAICRERRGFYRLCASATSVDNSKCASADGGTNASALVPTVALAPIPDHLRVKENLIQKEMRVRAREISSPDPQVRGGRLVELAQWVRDGLASVDVASPGLRAVLREAAESASDEASRLRFDPVRIDGTRPDSTHGAESTSADVAASGNGST